MPLTPSEARRAEQIEEAAAKRTLTQAELEEYQNLAVSSHRRALLDRSVADANQRQGH